MELSSRSFTIIHRAGGQETHVDALSRNLMCTFITEDKMRIAQHQADLRFVKNPQIKSGVVTIRIRGHFKAVVPDSLRAKCLHHFHDAFGHPGKNKTLKLISTYYWWPQMLRIIKEYVSSCKVCHLRKQSNQPTIGHYQKPDSDLQPFDLIGLNKIGLGNEIKTLDIGMPSHRRSNLSQRSNSSRVQHAYRLRETRAQNIRRLREQTARQATLRSLETPDSIHSRLQAHSERSSSTQRNTRTNFFSAAFGLLWKMQESSGVQFTSPKSVQPSNVPSTSTSCCLSGADGSIQILLSTAIIHIQDVNGEDQICRALLYNGSQRSLITEKCAAKLGIPIRRKRIAVGGLGDQIVESSLDRCQIPYVFEDEAVTARKRQRQSKEHCISSSDDEENPKNPRIQLDNQSRNNINDLDELAEGHDEEGPWCDVPKSRKIRIPPVIVENVNDWKLLCKELNNLADEPFQATISGPKHIIKAKNIGDFKKIREYVRLNNGGYSYKLQEEKPLKVVIKGVSTSFKIEDIAVELSHLGFKEASVKRLHRQSSKQAMNIVLVELPKYDSNKNIYNLTDLLYQKVVVESFRSPKKVTQCFNCQGFGHGQLNCFLKPKCVKCAEAHHTKDCPKKSKQYSPKNYDVIRMDRLIGRGGGTAIILRNFFKYRKIIVKTDYLENTTIVFKPDGKTSLQISSVYRKPDQLLKCEDLSKLFQNNLVIAAGDWNSKHPLWGSSKSNPSGMVLHEFSESAGLDIIAPSLATHYSHIGHPDFLDFAVFKNVPWNFEITTVDALSSDHLPVVLRLACPKYDFSMKVNKNTNWIYFQQDLINNPPPRSPLNSTINIDLEIGTLNKTILNTYSKNTIVSPIVKPHVPIFIRNIIREKNKARKKWQSTWDPRHREIYLHFQKKVNIILKKYNQQSQNDLINSAINTPNTFWRLVKSTRKKSEIKNINVDGDILHSDEEIGKALAFNFSKHFSIVSKEVLTNHPTLNETRMTLDNNENILKLTSPQEVKQEITKLSANKAPGHDEITTKLIKNLPIKWVVFLTSIFNASINLCYFPKIWKHAIVIPIPKKQLSKSLDDFRPISLLPIFGKIFERIILKRLQTYIDTRNVLIPQQFGFRANHSTTHQLITVIDFIQTRKSLNEAVGVVLLDLKKAFDMVWHRGLIIKLTSYNFPQKFIKFLENYLQDRTFSVKFGTYISSSRQIESGVPQGSILSPILFNLYINDIPHIPQCRLALFADDTALLSSSRSPDILISRLQNYLEIICNWCDKWKLILNPKKSQAIIFPPQNSFKFTPRTNLIIYSSPINWTQQAQPTKLRVVFDASTKTTTQISLNDLLHVGPKLQNNIFNILLKFRTNSVALVADIEKMYRQIRLHPDDIKYQTILWRDCKDLELQEFNLLTVTYGLACAPYLAIRTLHQIAHEVQVSNPRISKIIREDFYVDDLLTGCPTVEDAKGLVQQLIAVLGSGGFVLRKWVSNETSIIEDLPLLLRGKGEVMELNRKESGVNVLGIQWDPSCDTLNISCKSGPADIKSKRLIMHGFCDSSELAYSAVCYLRITYENNQIETILLTAKTKVAPIKKITIPRLELCAAVMLAQLQSQTTQALPFNIDEQFYWTDSKIVLAWITSESKKWQIFVANRVANIQDLTAAHSWQYISGKQNPADLATRGILPSCLINSKLWWHGPVWLTLDGSENIPSFTIDPSMGLEERSVILPATIAEPCPEFFSKYSSFTKLLRVMAWCKRFINITRKQPTQRLSFLTSQDLKDSLSQIVKIIQRYSQGILRVGGRLRHSDLDIDQKHPMLIPKDHFVNKLIVLHYHLNNLHSGTQLTLSLIRNKFWIPSGRNLIKRVLNQCLVCLKSKSKAIHQIMGDLPKNRLLPGRPFEKIGIDLAGPIQAKPMLKRSKVIFKFYIVLFVCFTTKAIHLEISSDLTAEIFLAALKRFISRRGRPTDIYSDNATNFKGASNILKERWKLFNAANIQDFSAIESINWHFIPPSAPNFGGLWEAGIKSVKTILSKTMKSRLLNYEELLTSLAQIEACLNSRPLTFVSNDPNDLTALTPGHFLIGNAMRHDAESDHSALNLRSRWSLIQPQRDYFWNRWSCEYLHQLQERRKWRTSHPDVNIGDLVMLKEQNKPLQWKLARIVQIFPGEDDHVRVVLLRQVYHRIGSLMPSENQPSRFLRIYSMGNDDDFQADRRCQQIQGVRRNIVQGLQRMLHQHNLLIQQFKTALENLPSDAYKVVVNADRTPPGQHPRRYNAPTANEVAVVLAGNQFGSRDIVLRQRDNVLQHVSDTHRFYNALQYPLIFWKGQEGYSFHISQIDPNTRQPLSSKVSSMDFYGYFIMVRRNSPNVIVQLASSSINSWSICMLRTLLYPDVPQYYTWNSSAHEWRRRVQVKLVEGWPGVKRSNTIGRVYAVHVSNFECFCLRMLLNNIKGPPSFAYLKIVNGSQYETFRETCAALGLMENDNHWFFTMDEAVLCQAPTRVRQLYAILISTCTISNPQQLWITYRDEMANDILHRYQLLDSSIRYNDLIYNETLCNIEDLVVSICGKKLQELGLGAPRRNVVTNSDILRELAYDTAELEDNVASMMPKLLPEQRRVFDAVLARINLSLPIIIFLGAPGGTGKTFPLNLLFAMVRKEQNITIAVASSGTAATLLAGGRTAHSVLKLPLTFAEGQTAVYNIRKNSDKASFLRSCKLLVWDECTMAHKIALEALDRTLQDIRDDPQPMGGLVVLLAGDFRQTLPVVTRVNMRVQLHDDTTAAQFADELLKIGEGQLETDSEGNIQFSNTVCQVVESSESLYEKVFPNICVNYLSEEWLCARTILAPKNSTVLEINLKKLNLIPGESKIYRSIDTMVDPDESVSYPPEFLNSLELSGTPSHKIVLK
ncbi:hypothetical protein LAZ67_4002878, partial [Cordylochernes scorpioides]